MEAPSDPTSSVDRHLLAALAGVLLLVAASGALVLWPRGVLPPSPGPGAQGQATARGAAAIAAILDAARRYVAQEEFPKARLILDTAVMEHPENQELRIALAETLLRTNELAESYEHYLAALAIGPRDAGLEFIAGTLASRLNRPGRAVEHYSAAQAADPSRPEYPLYLAQVQVKLNDDAAAKASLLRVVRLDESNATAWGTLADIMLRENALTLARQHIDKARALEPRVSAWKITEARLLKREGEPEKALLLLQSLDDSEKRLKPVLTLRAECLGLLSRPADAAAMYREASDAQPADAELAYAAAEWLDRAGEPGAADYARRAALLGHSAAESLLSRLVR